MFQEFAKRKFDDYLKLIEFPAGRVSFSQIKTSELAPYIVNFLEFFITNKNLPIDKKDFEEILNKAIIFNINYVIKPKNTILKFLFSEVETRPVEFIRNRLKYFQFYSYYTDQIITFIEINSLEMVSSNQITQLIDDINEKILEEIKSPAGEQHRVNLVKLMYYFFHDLGDNNPINIKLPKKILSAFFHDKGFNDIKARVDNFFSEEIFIQEAVELMNPETKKAAKQKSDVSGKEQEVKAMLDKAKTTISHEKLGKEVEKMLRAEGEIPDEDLNINIKLIREQETPKLDTPKLVTGGDIYSDDLVFASKINEMNLHEPPTEEDKRETLIKELFCEETYRRKIIKKIFNRSENYFKENVNMILNNSGWNEAAQAIEELYNKNHVDYLSEEAIKFVDIMQSHFAKNTSGNKAI
jgi:hypothetical protein